MIKTPKDGDVTVTDKLTIFLGGTIDNGASEDWQHYTATKLDNDNAIIYNPRNEEWDSDMLPVLSNPKFREQVEWELLALNASDIILLNFLPDSKSPITLLELGLFADSDKIFVVCPEKFYRSGNVHMICEMYSIPLFDTVDEFIDVLNEHISPNYEEDQLEDQD